MNDAIVVSFGYFAVVDGAVMCEGLTDGFPDVNLRLAWSDGSLAAFNAIAPWTSRKLS
jgi:hypothetical protein